MKQLNIIFLILAIAVPGLAAFPESESLYRFAPKGETDSVSLYRFGPDGNGDMTGCRIFDANGDGNSWVFSSRERSLLYESNYNEADDYIFLPPVEIKEAGRYRLSFEVMRGNEREVLVVGMGQRAVPSAFRPALTLEGNEIPQGAFGTAGTAWECAVPGVYYPALRVRTENGFMLYVRNIELSKVSGTDTMGMRCLPMLLLPTPAQASEFSITDGDGDGHSWRYQRDSVCFTAPGSVKSQADDWLVLPPFSAGKGNYAFSFDAKASGNVTERYDVRFGPDSLPMHQWQPIMLHPSIGNEWKRWKALFSVEGDSAVYRVAVRLATTGGDGVSLRDFKVEESTDTLLSLPCELKLDTAFTGQGDEWIILPPFKAPAFNNVRVEFQIKGFGPFSPQMELMEGEVADTSIMRRYNLYGGIVNREELPVSRIFYCGDPHGQHVVAFRIKGKPDWTGGMITTVRIDTAFQAGDVPVLPYSYKPENTLTDTLTMGPVWVDFTENMLGIRVIGKGPYRLQLAREERALGPRNNVLKWSDVVICDTTDSVSIERNFMAVPRGHGKHYLRLISISGNELRIDSITLERLPYVTTTPSAPSLTVNTMPHGQLEVDVKVVLPVTLTAGMEMYSEGELTVNVSSEVGQTMLLGYPGDTVTVRIAVPQGNSTITATAQNWAGTGMPAQCEIYAGADAPRALRQLMAYPDYDNRGALLRWMQDTIGVHGGYVEPDSMKYSVEVLSDSLWLKVAEVTGADSGLVRLPQEMAGKLEKRMWRVTPYNALGTAEPTEVTTLLGKPLAMPVTENYTEEDLPYAIISEQSDSVAVEIVEEEDKDPAYGHNRHFTMTPAEEGSKAALLLPGFTTDSASVPQLLLRVKKMPGAPTVSVELLGRRQLKTIDTISLESVRPQWTDIRIPLNDTLVSGEAFTVLLRPWWNNGTIPMVMSRYTIDHIRPQQLLLNWQSLPDTLVICDPNKVTATVTNIGSEAVNLSSPILRIETEAPVVSETTSRLRILPGETLSLPYTAVLPADYYGMGVKLNVAASTSDSLMRSDIVTERPVGAGRNPVVVDLAGEILSSPARIRLTWSEPVWNPVLGFREPTAFASTYKIYKNKTVIATSYTGHEYTDTLLRVGIHKYYVAYVVEGRECPLSNEVRIAVTPEHLSVAAIESAEAELQPVYGGIRCLNLGGNVLTIFRPDGTIVLLHQLRGDEETIALVPGFYIAQAGNRRVKIVVK